MSQLILDHPSVIKAIFVTFSFQGAYMAMGVYMLLLYFQSQKRDYLLYGAYLLLFASYLFIRIDHVFETGFVVTNDDMVFYYSTPLLFLFTGIYVKFIDTFAEIRKYNYKFSVEISIYGKINYILAALSLLYMLSTHDVDTVRDYLRPIVAITHLYSIYLVIRAFIVIKSALRYYVLASNLFLICFGAVGLHMSANLEFREDIYSNTLFGFYSFNASQLGGFLEMICFAIGLGYKFNQIELEKDKMKKVDNMKTQLYTNISHEIRTPLTLISGPIDNQLSKPDLSTEDKRELQLVKTNADRLLKLVNQMLDLSLIDSNQRTLKVSNGNMAVILKQLVDSFRYDAKRRNIAIKAQISDLDDVWFDRDVIEKVVANLLSNATKYAVDNSTIEVEASHEGQNVLFTVTNTTQQAKVSDLNQLFRRFYQENEATAGVGVGLALVKELVELTRGEISVYTPGNRKICFAVNIPVSIESFHDNEFIYIDRSEETDGHLEPSENIDNETTILVVEDDEDICEFTASLFRKDYRVLTAADGQDGLEQATKALPDVVITDIMMPRMSGIELCKALKTQVLTSHIPILMLTAKAGEANELEGYETGADTYLLKPYYTNVLKLKVRNLITDRNRFRELYSQSFSVDPTMAQTPIEGSFLNNLKKACETHITDSELTAEKLAGYMNMSRSHLHRKLQAVFGVSATAFIRSQRIRLASELLARGGMNVSEVAYEVGFSTVSYFNKCFKEQMNSTPQEYIQRYSTISNNNKLM